MVGSSRDVRGRVLVIDDNLDCAHGLRLVLGTEGYEAEVAGGGAQGLDRARELVPDIVLCDIEMPGIDGLQLARTMRADPLLAGATLVALTGHGDPDKISRVLAAGFDAHLIKPVFVEDLLEVLDRLASRRP